MKAIEFKIPRDSGKTIHLQHDILTQFFESYHIHHELQLSFISRGSGTAYVGDAIVAFEPGDVFLIGTNLPHVFKASEAETTIESYSYFFIRDFLGQDFFELSTSKAISELIQSGSRGFKINDTSKHAIAGLIKQGFSEKGAVPCALLLTILARLANSKDYLVLAGPAFANIDDVESSTRMSETLNYLTSNFDRDINLYEIASIANMSPTSFSRYFRQHTGKTYSRFLTEIRISHAKKLLLSSERTVANICFGSGFNNLSNFNRQFKKYTGVSPRTFRKLHVSQSLIQKGVSGF